ncbi:MAG: fimbrillin family protein [Bacteroides sp.]|nr:fimbrillin family protein [Bacteroides sp.]MBD5349166.1 fimbrillin family protein [Bacteroides sp.]
MKKLYFTIAIGSLIALASCTSEEPSDESNQSSQGGKISFRAEMDTRATEINNSNLNQIRVSGFIGDQTLFNGIDFTRGADSYFTSENDYYWPGDNTKVDFVAYAPTQPGGTISISPSSQLLSDFSPASNIADQIDFITSSASGTKEANEKQGLELVFNHRLSQIEINAKADNPVYVFKVTGIRIGQPVSKASYDFKANTWTLGTDKAIYETTYNTPVTLSATATNLMGDNQNAMLIPQQLTGWDPKGDPTNTAAGAYLSLRLQINTVDGAQVYPFPSNGNCIWASIPIDTEWEAGNKYIYNLDLSHGAGYVDPHDPDPGVDVLGGPIEFTVSVVKWADQNVDKPMNE